MISIIVGDITTFDGDAIVNAANETLLGGGGVDGAIHAAAGPELLASCREIPEVSLGVRCPTGECRVTPGHALPANWVIHTVGPVWRGGTDGEPDLLARCYTASLTTAAERSLERIAFPAISCGVFGYPIDAAARVATSTIDRFLKTNSESSPVREVSLYAFSTDIETALREALR